MISLLKTGFFDDIVSENGIEPTTYAARKRYDVEVFFPICDYLYSLGILDKKSSKLILSRKGTRLASTSVGLFNLLYAYSPIFENLEKLLRGEKKYGADLVRHRDYVAKGSTEITRYLPFPAAKRLLQEHGYRSVLDLGCGNGAFLFYIYPLLEIGFGVDLASDTITWANQKSRNEGFERLQFLVGDIFEMTKIRDSIPAQPEIITLMFVLHEFLYEGDNQVNVILHGLHESFPHAHLMICELCEASPELLRRNPTAICEHHLYHRLSHQGYATAEKWKQLFTVAGYRLKDELRFDFAEQGYFLLNPA
jgi:SAM-dependent methyltransferase